jgi:hypothetical protein
VTVTLAPGTLSQAQTLVSTILDSDENPNTGSPGIDSGATDAAVMGTDYVINAVAPRSSQQALVLRATSQYLSDTTATGITDYMPDAGLAPGVVR